VFASLCLPVCVCQFVFASLCLPVSAGLRRVCPSRRVSGGSVFARLGGSARLGVGLSASVFAVSAWVCPSRRGSVRLGLGLPVGGSVFASRAVSSGHV
jgi:hypothetical protein